MKRTGLTIAMSALMLVPACGGDGNDDALDGVDSIVFIQRQPQEAAMGDIFQNIGYQPPARLVTLTPPTADGTLEVICCDHLGPEFENMDINGYDISFDASEIMFSGRLAGDQAFGLFRLDVSTGEVEQLPTDPTKDYIYPTYLAGDKVMFNTTAVVEEGAPQFRDEYERGNTTQIGTINADGSGYELFARNLSHRINGFPMSDGRVVMTQWDHLADQNSGHLISMNPDGSVVKEAFGKEGTGVTNSYYKAVEAAPGRVIAIGSSRDRTIQSGTVLDIRLGLDDGNGGNTTDMSEANASYRILTPGVPLGREPSSATIGRYYSAYPLNNNENLDLLVSWSDGPVQSEVLAAANQTAQFGIYLLDTKDNQRKPLYDDPDMWDLFPRPLSPRTAPPVVADATANQAAGGQTLVGSMNVYDSSLDNFAPGSIYGVRVTEGFSVEEGIPNDFGLTESEGAAVLGTARVQPDNSWAARIPANIPVRLQVIDNYGMSLRNEPVWISGNAGEARFCGGCHEDRAATTVIQPGITEALAIGAADLMADVARYDTNGNSLRMTAAAAFTPGAQTFEIVDIPWGGAGPGGGDTGVQAIFDRQRTVDVGNGPESVSCSGCHNGVAGPANHSYQITDPETGMSQTITFDLTGAEALYDMGDGMLATYTQSHLSLLGPDMMDLEDAGLVVEGELRIYVETENARESELIKILNPPRLFDPNVYESKAVFTPNMGDRAFPTTGDFHENMLDPAEYYILILMADNGGQFYGRSNATGNTY